MLGDSLSSGYGLRQGSSWVDLLQDRITEKRLPYQVINASIAGDTTRGGLDRIKEALKQYNPRIVLIELGGNDGLRGLSLYASKINLEKIIQACRKSHAKVLLIGMQLPPNYGNSYTEQFQGMYQDLAKKHRTAFVPFLLEGFAENRELFQGDNIHPNEDAQPMMLDNVWPKLYPLLK